MSKCRSCAAPIRWVTMITSGRAMPLDVDPLDDGNIIVVHMDDRGDHARVLTAAELADPGLLDPDTPRYISHFTTCVDAGDWRRQRRYNTMLGDRDNDR